MAENYLFKLRPVSRFISSLTQARFQTQSQPNSDRLKLANVVTPLQPWVYTTQAVAMRVLSRNTPGSSLQHYLVHRSWIQSDLSLQSRKSWCLDNPWKSHTTTHVRGKKTKAKAEKKGSKKNKKGTAVDSDDDNDDSNDDEDNENTDQNFEAAVYKEKMDKTVAAFQRELNEMRSAAAASPSLIENVKVEAYGGTMTTLKNIAQVGVKDARCLYIIPFDDAVIPAIEKGLRAATNMGLNPYKEASGKIIVPVPKPSQEVRNQIKKKASEVAERKRNDVRKVRRVARKFISNLTGISQDIQRAYEKEIQVLTDKSVKEIDTLLEKKISDLDSPE